MKLFLFSQTYKKKQDKSRKKPQENTLKLLFIIFKTYLPPNLIMKNEIDIIISLAYIWQTRSYFGLFEAFLIVGPQDGYEQWSPRALLEYKNKRKQESDSIF